MAMLAAMGLALFVARAVVHPRAGVDAPAAIEPAPSAQPGAEGDAAASAEESAAPTEEVPPRVSIEVNIPATEMTLYENDVPLFCRRVAIGSGVYPTPTFNAQIKRIEWNPWWYPPPDAAWAKNAKPTPPGPGNPLGLAKIPLSGDILFHGTNKEWSVGHPASHGCMRMFNRDVTTIAWYLQSHFSIKRDPALRDLYRKNRGTTYNVSLATPVPVELVYRPVEATNGSLLFYPDHYNRIAGRRKAAIIGELIRHGVNISNIDDAKVDALAKSWPERGARVTIESMLLSPPLVSLFDAPVCE